jgi:hypothetical protein
MPKYITFVINEGCSFAFWREVDLDTISIR